MRLSLLLLVTTLLAVACGGSTPVAKAPNAFAVVSSDTVDGYFVTVLRHRSGKCFAVVGWGVDWPSSPKSVSLSPVDDVVCGGAR